MISTILLTMTLADPTTYLLPVAVELQKAWPANRTVNVVCHGHSVPAGYAQTPKVDTFNAYPHLLHLHLKERFPKAVINVIVTAIGGENSVQGAQRFDADVLSLRPDVVTIDYALNDRSIPLEQTKKAWTEMVEKAKAKGIKVILLTPSPDLNANILSPNDPLAQHAEQVRAIANEEGVGLADTYARFQELAQSGKKLEPYMAQSNHPNRAGHDVIVSLLLPWFFDPKP